MPSGSSRYQGFHGTFQKTGVPPDVYQSAMDSNVAKEQNRDGGKSRGGLPKHLQDQHGTSSKSDPKLCSPSPGGIYPSSYPIALGRLQHLLPSQSDNPSGREESGTPSREKNQNKPMSVQEQDLRSLGKTTMTAADFINMIILHQISWVGSSPSDDLPLTKSLHLSVFPMTALNRCLLLEPPLNLIPREGPPTPTSRGIKDAGQPGTEIFNMPASTTAGGSRSSKSSGRSNGRKAKSPGPGLSGSERPSSVSSVHSEGDCNRRTPLTNRVWEDRPLSAGRASRFDTN
ncbi:hypothetical protein XENOCAPTIV_018743 [Xenoophorus captivus]|uniref:Nuclear receptor corepressor 2 n=1 Tax=Xenoophorus captivus TaxID=1517983 RepID=A0ABV0SBY8_9TELE